MHPALQLRLDRLQLRAQPLPRVFRLTLKPPLLWRCPQMWVKPRNVKVSGLPSPRCCRSRRRTARIRSVASCRGARPGRTSRGVPPVLGGTVRPRGGAGTHDEIVGVAHDDHVACGELGPPPWPTGRRRSAGTRSPAAVMPPPLAVFRLRLRPLAVLGHSRPEPFLDQAKHPSVGDPVLEELHQPPVVDGDRRSHGCQHRAPSSPSSP